MSRFRRTPILFVILLSLILVATGCGSGASSPTTAQATTAPTATIVPTATAPVNTPAPTATPNVPSTCTAPAAPAFPVGIYSAIDSSGTFFDPSGTMWGPLTFTADGSMNRTGTHGCYALAQQQITFTEATTGGADPCPQAAPTGVYTWDYAGQILSFTLVNDPCRDRFSYFTTYRWEIHP